MSSPDNATPPPCSLSASSSKEGTERKQRHVVATWLVGLLAFAMGVSCVIWLRLAGRAAPHYLAGRALIESEFLVWTLKGDTFKESQQLLTSDAAHRIVADGTTLTDAEKEQRLWALMRAKRPRTSLDAAGRLLPTMNRKSRAIIADEAVRLGVQFEECVLEWLTYEAALDYAVMERIWKQQGSFKGDAERIERTLLEGMKDAPAMEKGIVVLAKTDHQIVVQLFGGKVIEGILPPDSETVRGLTTDNSSKVLWTSNYNYVRQALKDRLPTEIREQDIAIEDGKYVFDYSERLQDFFKDRTKIHWASLLSDNSPLAIAALPEEGEEESVSESKGSKPLSNEPRDNLREVFATWGRSVPLIIASGEDGDATGTGFLVDHRRKLLVVTNRHVIEGASRGVQVIFFRGSQRTDEKSLEISSDKIQVAAVHRLADVALLDISKAQDRVRAAGILPMLIAAKSYVPEVGNRVFAIGHPGGSGAEILTRTLTDGIISAVGHEYDGCRFIQITVPINPGNSGGPLFDGEGRVVGINTAIIRRSANHDIALEGLGFALEMAYVHELLTDGDASFDPDEIMNVLRPGTRSRFSGRRELGPYP